MTTVTYCKIISWYGRLGNNLMQIITAISYAKQHMLDYVYLNYPHEYLSSQVINISGTSIPFILNKAVCKHSHTYFDTNDIPNFKRLIGYNEISHTLFKIHVMPIYKHAGIHCHAELDTTNTLYIHIRSGDIFSQKKPHASYVQPPLAYYDHIIDEQKPQHIILVSEDCLNPCIMALLEKYKGKITHVCNTNKPQDDIAVLCKAKNIVFGVGTFAFYIKCVSANLETMWFPRYDTSVLFTKHIDTYSTQEGVNCNIIHLSIPNYIKVGEWKNTPAQRKIMLQYPV